jgi:signal transduction histidine kinase/CheY-like chemotaxis protein/HPt (histidine-containing phosphotransfer) domain-containing protein
MNKKNLEKNELFKTAHMVILLAYTIFTIILIGEALLMEWETWVLFLLAVCVAASWMIHIRQILEPHGRLWVYSVLMMGTFFFYGTHQTSTYDLAIVMSGVILIYTMTGMKKLITLCQVTYYVTMAYELINMVISGYVFDKLDVSRTLLHLAMLIAVGWLSRVIIDKWYLVLGESMEEIEFLRDSTDRLDDFLANVSHEIRTPVNAVVGLSGVCMEKNRDPELTDDLRSIMEAGKRVGEQISDILDYSEIDRKILVRNDDDYMLASVLNDLVTQLRPYMHQGVELVIDVEPAIPSVMHGDVNKIKRILWHLIMNGLKYTRAGGIYVRIDSIKEDYGINLCIEVTDTGIGMSPSELERVSERFYQADSGRSRQSGGLGLGMPIVKGFVACMGGFMTMESTQGVGTTVKVSIPQKVVDGESCMSLARKEALSLGAYLHFDKYPDPNVREYYNRMVSNIVHGLGTQMHRVDNVEMLKRLVSTVRLTHLFIAAEEYGTDPEYIEELAKHVVVVVVANDDFCLPRGSAARIMEKPFYCFPVVTVLNSAVGDDQREERMLCSGLEALVVDDEPMNLTVAKGIFKGYGMNVTTVLSGQEAIEKCRERSFDIVFMDHMMPGMDGIEAMKAIRADKSGRNKDMPIVALTANAVSTAKEMFLSEGFDGFVSKPVESGELERVLKHVLPASAVTYEKVESEDNVEKSGLGALRDAGMDTAAGLNYSQGDMELYKELLTQYVKEAPGKQDKIENCYSEKDYKNYEIFVHALKSTSRMVGATVLSEKAKELEELAKSGGAGITEELHDDMMKRYRKLTDIIRKAMDINVASADQEDTDEEILEFAPVSRRKQDDAKKGGEA